MTSYHILRQRAKTMLTFMADDIKPALLSALLEDTAEQGIVTIKKDGEEEIWVHGPKIRTLKQLLGDAGAVKVRMSHSGIHGHLDGSLCYVLPVKEGCEL